MTPMSTELLTSTPRSKYGPKLTPQERTAIIAAVVAGTPKGEIAKHFHVHPNTISQMIRQVKTVKNPANPLNSDFRQEFRTKAIAAVKSGLDSDLDPYKRANIGVRVLEGIGELIPSQVNVNLNAVIGQVPAELDDELVITPDKDVIDVDCSTPQDLVDHNPLCPDSSKPTLPPPEDDSANKP